MYDLIRRRLQVREPVLLDGALGTELVRRGVRSRLLHTYKGTRS